MRNSWMPVKLGDVAEIISDKKIELRNLSCANYISTNNMNPDRGGVDVAEKLPPNGKANMFLEGDTLFSNIRTYFKKVWHAKFSGGSSADVLIFRPIDAEQLDDSFLFYLLSSDGFIDSTIKASKGTKMPRGDKEAMLQYKLQLPALPTQRRIASILSVYDALIENNTRRIAILEEMARRLYEEWFVHFRFPGHDQVRMVESELGLIPEGWEVATVDDTFDLLGGGTPSRVVPAYWDGGTINWYSPTDLTRAGSVFMDCSGERITTLGLDKSSARLFPSYSVMMTSRATLGVIAVNMTEACTNQGFITCLPNKKIPLWMLYQWLKANVETFISLGTGATFKEITKGVFRTIKLAIPRENISSDYQTLAEPMMALALRLQRKNNNLRTQRDLLLPKLISGEIDVSSFPDPLTVAA